MLTSLYIFVKCIGGTRKPPGQGFSRLTGTREAHRGRPVSAQRKKLSQEFLLEFRIQFLISNEQIKEIRGKKPFHNTAYIGYVF